MCKIYNTIGSLSSIKAHLEECDIYDFKSLKDVIDFKNSYTILRQQLISYHENLIEKEKNVLSTELLDLESAIETQRQLSKQRLAGEIEFLNQQLNISKTKVPTNFFKNLGQNIKCWNYKRKIKQKKTNFENVINESIKTLVDNYQVRSDRFQFITSYSDEAVRQSVHHELTEIDRRKAIIDELNSFILGALGEQKVVKTLETLPDEYFLINDFDVSFSPAIYNSQEKNYIKSVQIDHILLGPSGIFLIETKNWSDKSLNNLSLRSPVQQIKRTSFVLFKLLNNDTSNHYLRLDKHHWGNKKISIRNLIVLTNKKPIEEFQFVKILTVNELVGYINYFKPIFSYAETERIANFLLQINNQTSIETE